MAARMFVEIYNEYKRISLQKDAGRGIIGIFGRARLFSDIFKRFNANQPRVPAGSSEGGQFASAGGTGAAGVAVSATGANKFVRGFSPHNRRVHYKKHEEEYPDMTEEEFGDRALELAQLPVGGSVVGHLRPDGQIVRYDKQTNDYVTGKPSLGVATMFKAKGGYKRYLYLKSIGK